MKISECCGAEIIYSDICSECKEHCDEEVAHKITADEYNAKAKLELEKVKAGLDVLINDSDIKGGLFDGAKLVEVINSGDTVCCDGCNGPYGDNVNGGVIIGHSAYCGECADKYHYCSSDYEHKHEINEFMDLNKSFKDNVLEYRKRTTGSSDGIMRIFTMD